MSRRTKKSNSKQIFLAILLIVIVIFVGIYIGKDIFFKSETNIAKYNSMNEENVSNQMSQENLSNEISNKVDLSIYNVEFKLLAFGHHRGIICFYSKDCKLLL